MISDRSRIDEAIDRAVREIMRRDPPAGLRGRVLARLDAPPRRARLWPAVAGAAVTSAIIMIAILRPAPPATPGNTPARDARQAAREVTPPPAVGHAQPPDSGTPAAERPRPALAKEPRRTATFGPRDGRISAASLTAAPPPRREPEAVPASTAPIEAAPSLPAIVVPALAPPAPIDIPPLAVPPIQIPRMQMAPVPPPR